MVAVEKVLGGTRAYPGNLYRPLVIFSALLSDDVGNTGGSITILASTSRNVAISIAGTINSTLARGTEYRYSAILTAF